MKRILALAGVLAVAATACGGARGTTYMLTSAKTSSYTPQTRTFLVTAVPYLGHEQTGTLDYLKKDFAKGGVLHGKEVFGFSPSTLVVYQGDTVDLTVVNPEDDPHTFTVQGMDVNLGVKAQASGHTTFTADQVGLFSFVCAVGEHSPYMWGQLVVLPDADAPTTGGSSGGSASGAVSLNGGTAKITMSEFSFTPSRFTVKAGTTVHFQFTNSGHVDHEAVFGDMNWQMRDQHGLGNPKEPYPTEVEVPAGQTKSFTYTFSKAGTYYVGCHLPGHWDAGMRATITVTG